MKTNTNSFIFKAVCSPGCENGGRCVSPGECTCANGYSGRRCEIRETIYTYNHFHAIIRDQSLFTVLSQSPATLHVCMEPVERMEMKMLCASAQQDGKENGAMKVCVIVIVKVMDVSTCNLK